MAHTCHVHLFVEHSPNSFEISEKSCWIIKEPCALETTRPSHLRCHHVPLQSWCEISTKGFSMPILSSMSAQICHQPSVDAQWQEPHCEDPSLPSDRAARWTAQQQEGTWYQCQLSDLALQELVCVCVSVRERETVHSAKWSLGAHVLTATRVCVEMKINEWETWMWVSGREWRVSGRISKSA